MLKKILIVLAVVVAGILVLAAFQPSDFRVTRTLTINAPASVIYQNVVNLKAWEAWSPWAKLDPNAKTTFEGPEAGVDAKMLWEGNMDVGKGSLTIVEVRENEFVKYDLAFEEPMKGASTSEFELRQAGSNVDVTWTVYGQNNYAAKVMSLLFNCEKMMGEQFDKGLAQLKAVAEASK